MDFKSFCLSPQTFSIVFTSNDRRESGQPCLCLYVFESLQCAPLAIIFAVCCCYILLTQALNSSLGFILLNTTSRIGHCKLSKAFSSSRKISVAFFLFLLICYIDYKSAIILNVPLQDAACLVDKYSIWDTFL